MPANQREDLEKLFIQRHHKQPLSNAFSMGKHHSSYKQGMKQVRHIQQPTRGRGVK